MLETKSLERLKTAKAVPKQQAGRARVVSRSRCKQQAVKADSQTAKTPGTQRMRIENDELLPAAPDPQESRHLNLRTAKFATQDAVESPVALVLGHLNLLVLQKLAELEG